jgi:hypothetical protein
MKLSEIVAYLNLLDTLNVDVESFDARRRLEAVTHVVETSPIQVDHYSKELRDCVDSINHSIGHFSERLSQLKQQLQRQVFEQEPAYLQESLRVFEHEMVFENNQYILDRRLKIDDESNVLLESRLRNLSDWRLSGMIFRPGLESHIEHLVPLDPLYVVDQHQELLNPAVRKFTPEYQRRLRQYVIDDRQPGDILSQLPNGQFGFVLAYNFFNFKPLQILNRYITELANKLRPGGTMLFTYNNCDRAHGVALAERAWMMYQPKRLILAHVDRVGLELVNSHEGLGDLSWLELRKPGNIESLRGGQTLAKIVALGQ